MEIYPFLSLLFAVEAVNNSLPDLPAFMLMRCDASRIETDRQRFNRIRDSIPFDLVFSGNCPQMDMLLQQIRDEHLCDEDRVKLLELVGVYSTVKRRKSNHCASSKRIYYFEPEYFCSLEICRFHSIRERIIYILCSFTFGVDSNFHLFQHSVVITVGFESAISICYLPVIVFW